MVEYVMDKFVKRGINMLWIITAILSAVFAGLTSILAKCGIKKTDSDLATALRTIVVLVFSWIMVFVAGSFGTITDIKPSSFLFLVLSGLATGASWIYVPTVLDTKKMPSFGTEIPKKGIKQGLSRSIADFGSPYLLYGIVTYRSTTQRGVSLAV